MLKTAAASILAMVCSTAPATAQTVLVYQPLDGDELMWYSGFVGLTITSVDEPTWSGMTTAQFAAYDLIWIGGVDALGSAAEIASYGTLDATKATWGPAISGRALCPAVHITSAVHSTPGAMTVVDDGVAWLLGASGTSLWVGQDTGAVGYNFLSNFGVTGCTSGCADGDTVTVTMPAHPAMAMSTSASLSNWGQSFHNHFTVVPMTWDVLAETGAAEPLIIAREFQLTNLTPCLPCAVAGEIYSQPLLAGGGILPYTWSVAAPTMLPAGLTIDSMTGVVSGVLATPGMYSFTIRVTDSAAPPDIVDMDYDLDGTCPPSCAVSLCGDCDGSGGVNILDPLKAAHYSAGLATFPSATEFANCNVHGEQSPSPTAEVGMADCLVIARRNVGLNPLTCCSGVKFERMLGCNEVFCGKFNTGNPGTDFTDLTTTHFLSLGTLPAGLGLRVSVVGTVGGDVDLYVGAPGTALGDENMMNYAFSATGAGSLHAIVIDEMSAPFVAADYSGTEVAMALKANVAEDYVLTIECTCAPTDITGTGTGTDDTATGVDLLDGSCGGGSSGPETTFSYTTLSVSNLTFSTDNPGTMTDTVLYVSLTGCSDPVTEVGCDDDGGTGTTSLLQLDYAPAGTYTIIVDSKGVGGPVELTVTELVPMGCPMTEGTIPAAGPFPHVVMGDSAGADDTMTPTCAGGGGEDHVYDFTPAQSGTYRISTCGSALDSVLFVRSSDCIIGTVEGCSDDAPGCGTQSSLDVTMASGTTYFIGVDSGVGAGGAYTLMIETLDICGATVDGDVTGMFLPFTVLDDTLGADMSFVPGCGAAGGPDHLIRYTPSFTGNYDIDTCGTSFDSILDIVAVDCTTGMSLGCNDNFLGCSPQSGLFGIALTAGSTYYLRVSGVGGAFGPYTLNVALSGTGGVPTEIPWVDPVVSGHTLQFGPLTDNGNVDVALPFSFPHWPTPGGATGTSTVGLGTNGAVQLQGGTPHCCFQDPLWTYSTGTPGSRPNIHVHGIDGNTGDAGSVYSFGGPSEAIFTWVSCDYWKSTFVPPTGIDYAPGDWTIQLHLLANGDFQIRQQVVSSDVTRNIAVGYSDGQAADNSIPGATGIDWNTFPIDTPTREGHVDIGATQVGGLAQDVVLYFQFHGVDGYYVTRLN